MRRWLTARAAGDPRITFRDRVPYEELRALIRRHHVVVSPSHWESWSNVVREALAGNRPVLATPVGGVVDAIEPGRTGWLTDDASAAALRAGIERLRERREEIARLIADGAPRAGLEARLDHEGLVSAYLELAAGGDAPAVRAPDGSITALISSHHSWGALERSLAALRRSPVPVRVVLASADGLPPLRLGQALADAVLVPSHQQAFHAGLRHARGDGLVLLLDARDELDAAFLPRALAALAADPALAYVSALPAGRVASPPLPNAAAATIGEGIGSGAMLVRRADLEAVGIPDRQRGDPLAATAVALAALNRWGTVIPEPLVRTSARRAQPPVDEWYPARVMPPATVAAVTVVAPAGASGPLRQAPGDAVPQAVGAGHAARASHEALGDPVVRLGELVARVLEVAVVAHGHFLFDLQQCHRVVPLGLRRCCASSARWRASSARRIRLTTDAAAVSCTDRRSRASRTLARLSSAFAFSSHSR